MADAVQVLLLMLEADDPAFEAAAVRWIARFASECGAVTLSEVHAAGGWRGPRARRGPLHRCARRRFVLADGVGAVLLCQGRWKGTVVTTIFGSGRNARRSRGAIWLCRLRCHQCRTTSSGRMTVSVTSGRWRRSASM